MEKFKEVNKSVFDACDLDLYRTCMLESFEKYIDAARQQGQNEAWELARKIALFENYGGFSIAETEAIFGKDLGVGSILYENTYTEAADKVKAWEEVNKFKIGDVVRTKINPCDYGDITIIAVCNASEKNIRGVYGRFFTRFFDESELVKTGRTLPVNDWLKQIEGENDTR